MTRVGFLLKVKGDRLLEYKEHHKNTWPEMLDALRRAGWQNYTLFVRDDGLLFGYFETPSTFEAALKAMAQQTVNENWQSLMGSYFEALNGGRPDERMLELQEIFHLD